MAKPISALLVDDEPHVRVFLRLLLAELGITRIWEAADGQQGLDLVEEHQPELVLLDLNLPVIGGLAVLKELQVRHPETPVIVVTSQNATQMVIDCQKYGAIAYVLKHSSKAVALAALQEAIDSLDAGEEDDGTATDSA